VQHASDRRQHQRGQGKYQNIRYKSSEGVDQIGGNSHARNDRYFYSRSKREPNSSGKQYVQHKRRSDVHSRNNVSDNHDNATYRSQLIIGSGSSAGLQAVSRNHDQSRVGQRKDTRGIFASRLHPKTSCSQLSTFIFRTFGLTVHPEKLNSKHSSYSSFYIPGDHHQRRQLLVANLWPAGSLIKPFVQ
jgi:hypothetical protein